MLQYKISIYTKSFIILDAQTKKETTVKFSQDLLKVKTRKVP